MIHSHTVNFTSTSTVFSAKVGKTPNEKQPGVYDVVFSVCKYFRYRPEAFLLEEKEQNRNPS